MAMVEVTHSGQAEVDAENREIEEATTVHTYALEVAA
jgi:hypothetical protein